MALKRKTVLILGAGASMPYGFPSGDGLKEDIISSLTDFSRHAGPATQLAYIMQQAQFEIYHVESFRDELSGASHVTIDRFLQNRPEFEKIGKLAIAATLIPFEQDSKIPMFEPRKLDSEAKKRVEERGWYRYFAQQLNLSATYWGDGAYNNHL